MRSARSAPPAPPHETALKDLEALARSEPSVAPLALLQAEALRAASDPAWEEGVPAFDAQQLSDGLPLLHNQTLGIDVERARRLLAQLIEVAARAQVAHAQGLRTWFKRHPTNEELLALFRASINHNADELAESAARANVEAAALMTLGQLSVLPLLYACGRKAAPLLADTTWDAGYCPTCAAWPTLAEVRGLERQKWLRCGRCGTGWRFALQRCAFCNNQDFRTLGYLAPEAERDSREAATCDQCHNYLKTIATISDLAPAALLVQDLSTLVLDVAALQHDYARPAAPGFPLAAQLEPLRRESRLPWRR